MTREQAIGYVNELAVFFQLRLERPFKVQMNLKFLYEG